MLIPLGLKAVEEELQGEVRALPLWRRSLRCAGGYRKRWGQNPGSVFVGDQKIKINVPRLRDLQVRKEVQLESYTCLQDPSHLDEEALSRAIHSLRKGKYERAAEHIPKTFGIKKSSISRKFIRTSSKKLPEFENLD